MRTKKLKELVYFIIQTHNNKYEDGFLNPRKSCFNLLLNVFSSILNKYLILTESGVSLLRITCRRWGGKIGGPVVFSQGLLAGISCPKSFWDSSLEFSLSLAKAWNT